MIENQQETNNQHSNKKNVIGQLIGFLIVVSIVILGSSLASNLLTSKEKDVKKIVDNAIKDKQITQEKVIVATPPLCTGGFEEYIKLKNQNKSITIVNNQKSYASKNSFVGSKDSTILISGEDDIACGYLYIKASKSNKPLDNKYDSVYVNPQDFGGHILRNKGILYQNTDTYTESLIPLDAVSYLPNIPYDPEAQNFRVANWVNLLNVNSHLKFITGLSTTDTKGNIEEISIAYKCWNAKTGLESENCQLSY